MAQGDHGAQGSQVGAVGLDLTTATPSCPQEHQGSWGAGGRSSVTAALCWSSVEDMNKYPHTAATAGDVPNRTQ